jgi:dCMP deaminase
MRISQDEYFMRIAFLVSLRSTCIRRKVGSVLTKNGHIISTGYNGVPSGVEHCTKYTCLRLINNIKSGESPELCRGVHSEVNCIIQSAIYGTAIEGNTTLYCTNFPCNSCLKLLMNSRIKRIVYKDDYFMDNEIKKMLVKDSNIEFEKFYFPEELKSKIKTDTKETFGTELAMYCLEEVQNHPVFNKITHAEGSAFMNKIIDKAKDLNNKYKYIETEIKN